MLNKIRILNFRSIEKMDLYFDWNLNNIVWKNWVWKTNVLQAISFLFWNNTFNIKNDDIIKNWENIMYLEAEFCDENSIINKIIYSYDLENDKKQILLNSKKSTKKALDEKLLKVCSFYPITMNLFYLGPKYRREFLDDILNNCYPEYKKLTKDYENVVKNRNKVLKNINLWNSKPSEIDFWDNAFLDLCEKIYKYRINICDFFQENISKNKDFFHDKNLNIEFQYKTKTNLKDIRNSINDYLKTNFQRDIILAKTSIWPHIDDFDILINKKQIINFASRWETKSVIMTLKLIEMDYLKSITWKTPILLIDDLSSELDEEHIDLFLWKINNIQTIFTSILALNKENITLINI